LLKKHGAKLPDHDALLTGDEFAERYLLPLAYKLELPLHTHAPIAAIGREGALKMEKIGEDSRGDTPFRLLVRQGQNERFANADLVFDCTGTYRTPRPLGDCGIPAVGELANEDRIAYGAPCVQGRQRQCVLVVGGGHSAATAVRDLAALPGTQILWAVRKAPEIPCPRIPDDPLPARDALAAEVNELVRIGRVEFRTACAVQGVFKDGAGVRVTLAHAAGRSDVRADWVIAATGFRPDPTLARELQVQTCWATEGTYPLAASLLGESGGDCLALKARGSETLRHPEPGYFALGMKSYGRSPDFLLRTGREQIESLLNWLAFKRQA